MGSAKSNRKGLKKVLMKTAPVDPNASPEDQKQAKDLTDQSNQQAKDHKTEEAATKKFLWMPMKWGIPVAIVGVAALSYGVYRVYKHYKKKA